MVPGRCVGVLTGLTVASIFLSACGSSATSSSGSEPRSTLGQPTPTSPTGDAGAGAGGAAAPLPYYDPSRNPDADIDAALASARTDGKRVLLDFGADWCPDCQVLSALYADPSVRPTLDAGYHLVPVDVGRFDRNVVVSHRYGDVIKGGIPALVVLDADRHVLVATRDGSFADARTMKPPEVLAFLQRWAPRP